MDTTVQCPGCQVHLALPSFGGPATVQCPRCQHVFEPICRVATASPPGDGAALAKRHEQDDDDILDRRRIAPPRPFRGQRTATAACVMILLASVFCLLQAFIQYQHMRVLREQIDHGRVNLAELEWLEDMEGFARPAQFTLFLAALVCFLVWIHQAACNAQTLRASALHYLPGWAVFSFFVPVLNLFAPCGVLQELWRSSDPEAIDNGFAWKSTARSKVVIGWWILWLAAGLFVSAGSHRDPGLGINPMFIDPEAAFRSALLYGIGNFGFALVGLLQIYLVHKITQRQRDRYTGLYEARD